MDTEKLRFTVDRIEEDIAVCICELPPNQDGTESERIVNVPLKSVAGALSEGDVFDACFSGGIISEIEFRRDIREMRMKKNRSRLNNLFNRNKNQ